MTTWSEGLKVGDKVRIMKGQLVIAESAEVQKVARVYLWVNGEKFYRAGGSSAEPVRARYRNSTPHSLASIAVVEETQQESIMAMATTGKPVTTQRVNKVLRDGGVVKSGGFDESGYFVKKQTGDDGPYLTVGYRTGNMRRGIELREMARLLTAAGINTVYNGSMLIIEGDNLLIQSIAPATEATPAPEQPAPVVAEHSIHSEQAAGIVANWVDANFPGGIGTMKERALIREIARALDEASKPAPVEAEAPANAEPLYIVKWHNKQAPATTTSRRGLLSLPEDEWNDFPTADSIRADEERDDAYLRHKHGLCLPSCHWCPKLPDAFQVTPPSEEDAWEGHPTQGWPNSHYDPAKGGILTIPHVIGALYLCGDGQITLYDSHAERYRHVRSPRNYPPDAPAFYLSQIEMQGVTASYDVQPALCTCGAIREGYQGRGPHHHKYCPLYSQDAADQDARHNERVVRSAHIGIREQMGAIEYEDWAHTDYSNWRDWPAGGM